MRNDLLLLSQGGSPPSWMKNGLVALYDPYRSTYGRNMLPTGANPFSVNNAADISIATSQDDSAGGTTGIKMTEKATTAARYCQVSGANAVCLSGAKYAYVFHVKPAGTTKIRIYPWVTAASKGYCDYDLTGDGAVHATVAGTCACSGTITALSGGWYRVTFSFTADATGNFVYGMAHLDDSYNLSFLGSTDRSLYVSMWQKCFNSVMPYSAPSGAPGTLQTLTDYSGAGNSLTLGASSSAGADDPSFTGTAVQHTTDDILLGSALSTVTMLGDWTIPMVVKPAGTTGTLVSLADGTKADQYQAVEFNGSTKVRIHTVNGATSTYSDDLTVSNSTIQMLVLTSSGNTLTLTNMGTGASVTATNADPTGNPRVCVGGVGTSTVGGLADALSVYLLGLVNRAWGTGEATRVYRYWKSLEAGRGVTVA